VKIDQTLKTVAPAKTKDIKGGKSSTLARSPLQDTVQDQVDLTGNSNRLRELENRLAQLEITDPQKIEAIRQAIAEGRFKVDDEVVADGMIKEALDFLSHMNR
jgi:negative regulator of flagellin synthesis FlgM